MRKSILAIAAAAAIGATVAPASAAPGMPFGVTGPAVVTPVYMDEYERYEREMIHRDNMAHQRNRYYQHLRNREHSYNRYRQHLRNQERQYYRYNYY